MPKSFWGHCTGSVSLPVSVGVHERELEADESVQIRVIVPGRFVQEENVPVSRYKHQTGKAIKKAEHDTNSACKTHKWMISLVSS